MQRAVEITRLTIDVDIKRIEASAADFKGSAHDGRGGVDKRNCVALAQRGGLLLGLYAG